MLKPKADTTWASCACPKSQIEPVVIYYSPQSFLRSLPVDYQLTTHAYIIGKILINDDDDRFSLQAVCLSGGIREILDTNSFLIHIFQNRNFDLDIEYLFSFLYSYCKEL